MRISALGRSLALVVVVVMLSNGLGMASLAGADAASGEALDARAGSAPVVSASGRPMVVSGALLAGGSPLATSARVPPAPGVGTIADFTDFASGASPGGVSSPSKHAGPSLDPAHPEIVADDVAAGRSSWHSYDLGPSPEARSGMMLASDDAGMILMFGGQNATGVFLGDTWTYDSSVNQWLQHKLAVAPPARWLGSLTYDSSALRFIMFGGYNGTVVLNDTWTFDMVQKSWIQLTPIASPLPLFVSAFAYDPSAGVSVLQGGLRQWIGDPRNETWVFDFGANTWTDVTPAVNPGLLGGGAMAFSSSLGRLVFFGGNDYLGGGAVNGTWSFDTANSTWTRLSFTTGPQGLEGTSMAADPASGDLTVFGGWNGVFKNETWTFEPVAGRWTQVMGPYEPSTRGYGGMAHDAATGLMVLFGGHDFGAGGMRGDTWLFDPATSMWREAPVAAPSQIQHGTSLVYSPATGRIYRLFAGPGQNETLIVDPAGSTVQATKSQGGPSGRRYHASAGLDQWGKILVFGNFPVNDNRTYLYDVEANTWSSTFPAGSPAPRQAAAMAYDPVNRRAVMFGGIDSTGTILYPETWLFDPANGTWKNNSQAVQPRAPVWPAMTYDSVNKRVLLFGGLTRIGTPAIGEIWAYDVAENRWTNLTDASTPGGRMSPGMAFDRASGRVVIFGGSPTNGCGGTDFRDTLGYDVRSGVWSFLTPNPSPVGRCLSSMVADPVTGRMLMIGGLAGLASEMWVYDPIGNEWTEMRPQSVPPGRYNFAHGFDPVNRRFVAFSGFGGADDTWELDVSTNVWKMISPAVKPTARGGTRMAFDTWNDRFVMFSGSNGVADTWTYDASQDAWTLMNTASGPGPMTSAAIAFDESLGKSILFAVDGATWTYDLGANSWRQMRPTASPSARSFVPLLYLPSIGRTMLFGGSTYTNDTWLYDAKADNWTQVAMTGPTPPARAAHNLVYDGSTGKALLWGGNSLIASDAADTWAFDPDTLAWTELRPRNAPGGRQGAGMGYDPESKRVVMFGGFDFASLAAHNDMWYFDLAIAPTVVSTTPADGATGVAKDASIKVTFDMDMDPSETAKAFSISPSVPGSVAVSGPQLTFSHASRFARGTTYTVTVSTGARNTGGDTMVADRQFKFTTLAPPSVVLTDPVNNASGVALDALPALQFSEAMNATSTINAATISPAVNGAFLFAGARTMVFGHLEPFAPRTVYTITVSAAAQSATGDNLAADYVLKFTTGPADPPRVASASPPDGATQVNDSASATIVFSQPMDRNATVAAIMSSPVAAWSAVWSQGDRIVVLTPAPALKQGTKYTITVGTGAQSKLGSNLSAPFAWSFTITAWTPPPPPPPLPTPRVVSVSPSDKEENVNATAKVVISFSEPMDKSATEKAITSPGGADHTFAWNTLADSVTLTPVAARKAGTITLMDISLGAKSAAGVNLSAVHTWSFTVAKWTPPPPAPVAAGPDIGMLVVGLLVGIIAGIVVGMILFKRRNPAAEPAEKIAIKGSTDDVELTESPADEEKKGQTFQEAHGDSEGTAPAGEDKGSEGAEQRGKGIVKGIGSGGSGSGTTPVSPPPPPPPPPGKSDKPLPYIPPPDSKK